MALDFVQIFNILSKANSDLLSMIYEGLESVMEFQDEAAHVSDSVAQPLSGDDEISPEKKRELLLKYFQATLLRLKQLPSEQADQLRHILSTVIKRRGNHSFVVDLSINFARCADELVRQKRRKRRPRDKHRQAKPLPPVSGTIDDDQD